MSKVYEKLSRCLEAVRDMTDLEPEVALVLGSGLGDYAEKEIEIEQRIDYGSIPGFPVSTVPGHEGAFILGKVSGKRIICMKGRVHCYEGYELTDVVLPCRLMAMMGAKTLLLTNASGGINPILSAGDLMLIRDHISVFVGNPLKGPNDEELGTRFPDMSHVYDADVADIIRKSAEKLGINLKEGVYVQLPGPSFETPAEIRMLATLGADAVGMSTVVEAIAANHMGLRIGGISCVCNMAAGIQKTPLTHEEVQEAAAAAAPLFRSLLNTVIGQL